MINLVFKLLNYTHFTDKSVINIILEEINIDPNNSGDGEDSTKINEEFFIHQVGEHNKVEETDDSKIKDEYVNTNGSLDLSKDGVEENKLMDTVHLENESNETENDMNNNDDDNLKNSMIFEDKDLDLKEKAIEEKQMLDRLISMVQTKINLARKNKKEENK